MNCQRSSFRWGAVAALWGVCLCSVSLGTTDPDSTLADRAAEALWLLSEPSLDRPEGIIPAGSMVDFVAWQDDLLHIELTLPLPEDHATLSPIACCHRIRASCSRLGGLLKHHEYHAA